MAVSYTHLDVYKRQHYMKVSGSIPKTAKTVSPARKVMVSIFWDSRSVVLIDYLENGKTIRRKYYSALLEQVNDVIMAKCLDSAKKKCFSIKVMHSCINCSRKSLVNCTTDYCHMYCTHQIQLPVTFPVPET